MKTSKIISVCAYVQVCCLHICLCVMYVPREDREGHWIPWNWSYRQLGTIMWVLGTKTDSRKASNALSLWAISPALQRTLLHLFSCSPEEEGRGVHSPAVPGMAIPADQMGLLGVKEEHTRRLPQMCFKMVVTRLYSLSDSYYVRIRMLPVL